MKLLVLLVLFGVASAIPVEEYEDSSDKLNVTIYYETLCPYSRTFLYKQFYPTWIELREYMQVELVPYGFAEKKKVNGKWRFRCQHGPEECCQNKIHGCVLQSEDISEEEAYGFISCLMSDKKPEKCAEETKIKLDPIMKCAKSSKGDDILAAYGDKTPKYPEMEGVPNVVYNDKFNKTDWLDSLEDFKSVVCRHFPMKPLGCSDENIYY